jgi:translation initiation factor IF-2
MAHTTIEHFATDLKMPAGALLEQLTAAGVAGKKQGDNLSEQDKTRLLDYLRKQHGAAGDGKKRITLTRKSTSEIKAADSSGKARTIQVEVRKKRTFIKRDDQPAGAGDEVVENEPDEADLQRREDEAKAQAELLRQQANALLELSTSLDHDAATEGRA